MQRLFHEVVSENYKREKFFRKSEIILLVVNVSQSTEKCRFLSTAFDKEVLEGKLYIL